MGQLSFFQHDLLPPKFYRAPLESVGFYLLLYNVLYIRKSPEISITDLQLEMGIDIDTHVQDLVRLQVITVTDGIIKCPEAYNHLNGTLDKRAKGAIVKAGSRAYDNLDDNSKTSIEEYLKDWETIFPITTVIRNTVYKRVLDKKLPVSGFPLAIKFLEKYPEIKKRDPATWCDLGLIGKSWDELEKFFFPKKIVFNDSIEIEGIDEE